MTAARRFQHRLEVFIDRSLEHLGMTFAQYRALEVLDANNDIHLSELARLFRVSRQAAGSTVAMLDRGALVDPVREAGRVYVTPSDVGRDRLVLCRRFTEDLKAQLEEHLTHGELHRLVLLLEKAGAALRSPALPEWWLAP